MSKGHTPGCQCHRCLQTAGWARQQEAKPEWEDSAMTEEIVDVALNMLDGHVAEIAALRAEVEDWKRGSQVEADEADRLRAENERLTRLSGASRGAYAAAMSVTQHDTYTIRGLRVPQLEADIAELREAVAGLRVLLTAATDAITRVDQDVALILEALHVDDSPVRTEGSE